MALYCETFQCSFSSLRVRGRGGGGGVGGEHPPRYGNTLTESVNAVFNKTENHPNNVCLHVYATADKKVLGVICTCSYSSLRCGGTPTELRSCVKVGVDDLGSPSLINLRFLWT